MLGKVLRETEAKLSELGHRVEWTLIGPQVRHGSCRHCGKSVTIESSHAYHRAKGPALEGMCRHLSQSDAA